MMKREISEAITFLVSFMGRLGLSEHQIQEFSARLSRAMMEKYQSNWNVTMPLQGNAYRAISILDGRIDPLILRAAHESRIDTKALERCFPRDFVLWVDPEDVSYRMGDYGTVCRVFTPFKKTDMKPRRALTIRHPDSHLAPSVPVTAS